MTRGGLHEPARRCEIRSEDADRWAAVARAHAEGEQALASLSGGDSDRASQSAALSVWPCPVCGLTMRADQPCQRCGPFATLGELRDAISERERPIEVGPFDEIEVIDVS